MYHPTRGGTRGGQADFTWDQVRSDQHRENYLGHSVLAPTGRWQKNKDVNWYNKDKNEDDQVAAAEKRRKELMEVKMREEEEMNKRLGIKTSQTSSSSIIGESLLRGSDNQIVASSSRASTGANRAPLDPSKSRWNASQQEDDVNESKISKEDKRAARKLAKMQVKEERREERRRRREERDIRKAESSSDVSEDDDRRNSKRYRREDRSEGYDGPSRDSDRYDSIRKRDYRTRGDSHGEDERSSRRGDLERFDDGHRRGDRGWSPYHDLDRRGDGEESRYRKPHRDRSRSSGRSNTPDMQRRRRD